MGSITAAEVNQLRKRTGAGMMDCKKALVEADGNIDNAIELLRKKGQKVAAKRSGREASEGIVMCSSTEGRDKGVMIMLNCETDFVAKNEDFISLFQNIMHTALQHLPENKEALLQLPYAGSEISIQDKIIDEIGKIGEKIELSSYEIIEAEQVTCYNHPGNRVAAMTGTNASCPQEVAKDLSMQIAAMAPIAIDQNGIPEEIINKEIEIGKEQAINAGKPAELAEKIARGKLNKFFKENTLLNQQFIKDNKKTVARYLDEYKASVTVFRRGALND